jgi:hypothetical protein
VFTTTMELKINATVKVAMTVPAVQQTAAVAKENVHVVQITGVLKLEKNIKTIKRFNKKEFSS